ncbi:ATP-binding protein [Oscillatoria sp. CS-180]|uniref:slr1658 superfamily regulator n=1 Tax=Oscillatoria sp. CS-180 TaxID=3021720 RepID=UPI00232ED3D5|nr:ATP-binding protein [Oscillatoria sp. CS-180]MDB9527516.1 ATP-binding protein [Oscillatoria sp. CS-180]
MDYYPIPKGNSGMEKTFGDFITNFPPDHDSLELSFTPTSERIRHLWRNQRLSAHFIADYFVNFLPLDKDDPVEERRIKEAKGAISYVANELLENAMKFNLEDADCKVRFGIHFLDGSDIIAVMFATNSINRFGAEKFQQFIQELLESDPEEFYIRQVEASAEDPDTKISGLGFLTMINDYQAKLGWQFEPVAPDSEISIVTAMVQIAL